ncbi:S-methyl-5-thioribose-1-phosphate isomerase [Methyloversatilis sp.]|uniref:S-methyl-5-thioribose-1-phosphate isomerase n=1 Tax=Methyloversatilis sp. TaxID=2569862 RepID=UPI002735651A|nr:S-methyl-5-thioribose-1-phosphate isomerase [Methyloversatilis sp.]MDP2868868.1 S-methyl-5-thioribose-1-phosphate isomerase [Methyloversatilis sp.]MDP3454840.1 S-methyl-5-thioribose-1-phosphate isomerase [Methyloversatilis sp.]MDP3577002.1 S-methyl-5-thioribose-1-phosphate isomerase [Methyloversatilis sp.]
MYDTPSPLRLDGDRLFILDQTLLPFAEQEVALETGAQAARAIATMQVRGAPLIGAIGAFGLAMALRDAADDAALDEAVRALGATRPTAVNLAWALHRVATLVRPLPPAARAAAAWREALAICDEDRAANRRIGELTLELMQAITPRIKPQSGRLNLMTHCNAGWLATTGWGTALAGIYLAHAAGIDLHVWVSETRPRNQGLLTAWELAGAGVPHTVIADNAAGQLMREGQVDAVIIGADRVAANGDVANKVGSYLKALAARDSGLPFWVAAPWSTVDEGCAGGASIPIEARDGDELRVVRGAAGRVRQLGPDSPVANPAFDITPAHLVTALITERGIVYPAGGMPEGVPEGVHFAGTRAE